MIPVFGKTEGLFMRDPNGDRVMNPSFDPNEPWTASVKKDGSCGLLMGINGSWGIYRRQEIDHKSRNYSRVQTGQRGIINGYPCWFTTMIRGSGKHEKEVPLYVFELDAYGLPAGKQIIGFTPIDAIEDKWVMSATEANPEEPSNPFVWTTESTHLDLRVVKRTIRDTIQQHTTRDVLTVELMCRKFADHYGYQNDRCYVSPHGAEQIPKEELPSLTNQCIKAWFQIDSPWANQEGFVILQSGKRFKVHRGMMDMEDSWRVKKACGLTIRE